MNTFHLPDLGEGLQDAEIVAWHVSPGDHVVADQPLVSVETAKAVVEIPSPEAGRIAAIYGKPGDVVKIGAKLVDYGEEPGAASESVVGELPHEDPVQATPARSGDAVKAAPAVRRLARELGVDLAGIAASGPDGSLTADDVRTAAGQAAGAPGEALRGPRRAMAQAMTRAGAEVVPATVTDQANIADWTDDADPMQRLIAAVVAAAASEPALNAWYDGTAMRRVVHDHLDLGIAVDTPEGLFVPVLKRVEAMDQEERHTRLEALKNAVHERTIAPQDMSGATFTLSNFGAIAGRHGVLVVMPPQVAILGAGRIASSVLAVAGKPRVCRTLPLSLSFDHRAVTGGEAARFLAAVIASLEQPD